LANDKKLKHENESIQEDCIKLSKQLDETLMRLEQNECENQNLKSMLVKKDSDYLNLEDYQETQKSELKQVQEDLAAQSEKRNRIEFLFQDVSEREMRLQRQIETTNQENEILKVAKIASTVI